MGLRAYKALMHWGILRDLSTVVLIHSTGGTARTTMRAKMIRFR